MSRIYDCADETVRKGGVTDAASAVRKGELVVLPTDTVYGIGTDAFNPAAVSRLLQTKGRGRDMPPPVLVGSMRAATALVEDLGNHGRDLMEEFWPGPLTLVCSATPSLTWDLGDTKGTVAVRMPMSQVALDLLKETGPMAVSSANKSGGPAAVCVEEAVEQLGEEDVAVYLDGGETDTPVPSTIVDLTYAVPRVLRSGAIPIEQLREVCGTVIGELRKSKNAPGPQTEAAGSDTESGAETGTGTDRSDGEAGQAAATEEQPAGEAAEEVAQTAATETGGAEGQAAAEPAGDAAEEAGHASPESAAEPVAETDGEPAQAAGADTPEEGAEAAERAPEGRSAGGERSDG